MKEEIANKGLFRDTHTVHTQPTQFNINHPLPQRNIYAQLCINTALNITIDLRAKILRDYIAVILTHSFLSLKNLLGI